VSSIQGFGKGLQKATAKTARVQLEIKKKREQIERSDQTRGDTSLLYGEGGGRGNRDRSRD